MAASLTIEDLNKYSDKLSNLVDDINDYSTFIETGTSYGFTIKSIWPYFSKIWTVELSEELYNFSFPFTSSLSNCIPVFGDSLIEMPKFLRSLDKSEKSFFWLDAHYSSGNTSKNHLDCPLIEECILIDNNYQSNSAIIVIDDVRLFGTNINEDWSYISENAVKKSFNNFTIDFYEIIDDRLVLLINRKKND